MNTQWKTTTGKYDAAAGAADDPVVPQGAGWALVGTPAAVDGMLIWTWVRSRQVPPAAPLVNADNRSP
jgi:hypothetical protein